MYTHVWGVGFVMKAQRGGCDGRASALESGGALLLQ